MCGIVGFLDKSGNRTSSIGQVLFDMLVALGRRGPDSAGVALYGDQGQGSLILRITAKKGVSPATAQHITDRVKEVAPVTDASIQGAYLRLLVNYHGDPTVLERTIEAEEVDIEVVSMGTRLEVVKQVGSPQNLESTYGVSTFVGTHGIGHTRMSTESRVDLSHSQPFWAHGLPDLAIVHNGHITNYHKLRRRYEQRGYRVYTENDSEIIGLYLADLMSRGVTLSAALHSSLRDLDGAFSYLVATAEAIGYVKDSFGFKPLMVAETPSFVALATEEIALRAALGGDFPARELGVKQVQTWHVDQHLAAAS